MIIAALLTALRPAALHPRSIVLLSILLDDFRRSQPARINDEAIAHRNAFIENVNFALFMESRRLSFRVKSLPPSLLTVHLSSLLFRPRRELAAATVTGINIRASAVSAISATSSHSAFRLLRVAPAVLSLNPLFQLGAWRRSS